MHLRDHNDVLAYFSRSKPKANTFLRLATALGFSELVAQALYGTSVAQLGEIDAAVNSNLACATALYFGEADLRAPVFLHPIYAFERPAAFLGSGKDLFESGFIERTFPRSAHIPSRTDLAKALDTAVLADAGIIHLAPSFFPKQNYSKFLNGLNSILGRFKLCFVDGGFLDRSHAYYEAREAAELLVKAIGAGPASAENLEIYSLVDHRFADAQAVGLFSENRPWVNGRPAPIYPVTHED